MVPDPTWVDLQLIPRDANRYHRFNTPREYYDSMVADAPAWALGADGTVVRCVTSALARTVVPWLVDAQLWRRHLGDFCSRLCAHREHRATALDARLDREHAFCVTSTGRLEQRLSTLETTLGGLDARLAKIEHDLHGIHEMALLRPASVIHEEGIDRVRRAQLRAVSSRSPDPRAALSAMRKVEQMDRHAMARHESAGGPWKEVPQPSQAFS